MRELASPPKATQPTALAVSELFESIQGEGPSAGTPCTFLRLAGCNLSCTWCDTAYSWDFSRYQRAEEVSTMGIEAVQAHVACSTHPLLVVTGGEPLLQQAALVELLSRLPASLRVEIETNGTVVPVAALAGRVNQWNVSPKLGNSAEPMERRWNSTALRAFRDTERAWLKFVIESPRDLEEADACFRMWGWRRDRVLLMPRASTPEELRQRGPWIVEACVRRDWRFSPRLQVELWPGKRGV